MATEQRPLDAAIASLIAPKFLAELRALLWTKPIVNHGWFDGGWSCRDHAVVLAALLALDGHEPTIRHGKCTFVQGATADQPPVGFGQEPTHPIGHSWLAIGAVNLDLSPQLNTPRQGWRPLKSIGVIGNRWLTEAGASQVALTGTTTDYEHQIAIASHLTNELRAIYLLEREEPFDRRMLTLGYVNSPLTDRIRRFAGELAYSNLVSHLDSVRQGGPTFDDSGPKAWRTIGRTPHAQTATLESRLAR